MLFFFGKGFDAKASLFFLKLQLLETKLSVGKKGCFETFSFLHLEAYGLCYRGKKLVRKPCQSHSDKFLLLNFSLWERESFGKGYNVIQTHNCGIITSVSVFYSVLQVKLICVAQAVHHQRLSGLPSTCWQAEIKPFSRKWTDCPSEPITFCQINLFCVAYLKAMDEFPEAKAIFQTQEAETGFMALLCRNTGPSEIIEFCWYLGKCTWWGWG